MKMLDNLEAIYRSTEAVPGALQQPLLVRTPEGFYKVVDFTFNLNGNIVLLTERIEPWKTQP